MNSVLKAIIFDMDGVIFDSESIYRQSFLVTAQQYQLNLEQTYAEQFVGRSTPDCHMILQKLFNHDDKKTEQFFHDWGKARQLILSEKNGVDFKLGFVDLLTYLRNFLIKKAIVTSANLADLTENFSQNQAVSMDEFDHIVTIEAVKHPKPNPEPYLLALNKLQLIAKDCVVIEDSVTGASAAVAAGIKTIMLADNVKPDESLRRQLWFVAQSHQEIKQYLQTVLNDI